jgi:Predicted transcriptional regulator
MSYKYSENEILEAKAEKKRIDSLHEKHETERKAFKDDYNLYAEMEMDFQEKLTTILEKKKVTAHTLAENVDIAPETLSRYRSGNGPSFEVLVAICIALELDIKQSSALFSSLGYSFLGTSKEHYAYAYLIENHSGKKISECNEILTGLGISVDNHLYPHRHIDKIRIKKNLEIFESL